MNRKYFGTDGVRGEYGNSILTDGFAYRLGQAAGLCILERSSHPVVAIGRDTRHSGMALRDALAGGFQAVGDCRVLDLGVLPTPAVAVVTRNLQAHLGIVITASHNPAKDNGIKFFNSRGLKLSDGEELDIEGRISSVGDRETRKAASLEPVVDGAAGYLDLLQPILPPRALNGLNLVVDTAHGATFDTTPRVLRECGANVIHVGGQPNGSNINDGVGSEFPLHLSRQVREHGADLGIAHDGDGDRVVFCDELGNIIDGDVLLCILGLHELKHGRLFENTLVATVQSNLGLDQAITRAGGRLVRTDVGDRYVLKEMLEYGFNLGGENSGHVIFKDINPAGDGLLAALKLLGILIETGRPLSALKSCMNLFPHRTGAIPVSEKPPLESMPGIQASLAELRSQMGGGGRVLLRYSGTETKIRLLIEGENLDKVNAWYQALEHQVKQYLA